MLAIFPRVLAVGCMLVLAVEKGYSVAGIVCVCVCVCGYVWSILAGGFNRELACGGLTSASKLIGNN